MKKITIIIEEPNCYTDLRKLLVWKGSTGPKLLCNMDESHIKNALNWVNSHDVNTYNGYTRKEWEALFKLELEFRKLLNKREQTHKLITKLNKKLLKFY